MLAVVRLTVDKDYDTLVEAMKKLKHANIKLVLAGGASEAEYAERLFALNSDSIKFIGRACSPRSKLRRVRELVPP